MQDNPFIHREGVPVRFRKSVARRAGDELVTVPAGSTGTVAYASPHTLAVELDDQELAAALHSWRGAVEWYGWESDRFVVAWPVSFAHALDVLEIVPAGPGLAGHLHDPGLGIHEPVEVRVDRSLEELDCNVILSGGSVGRRVLVPLEADELELLATALRRYSDRYDELVRRLDTARNLHPSY